MLAALLCKQDLLLSLLKLKHSFFTKLDGSSLGQPAGEM